MPGPKRKRNAKKIREVNKLASQIDRRVEKRGGARVGAGRPPSTKSLVKRHISIREMTDDIVRAGKLPLRVMINNMIFYDEKATFVQEEMEAALADHLKSFSPAKVERCLELMVKLGDARMSAQKCACDAAPFLHPRLSAIQMDVHKHDHPRDLPKDATIEAHRDDFRRLRSVPMVSQPDTEVVAEPVESDE